MIIRLIAALFIIGSAIAQDDWIAKTTYGSIQGYETTSNNGTRVKVFKAVPFAAPPVGDLRWKLPEWPKKWNDVKDGTKYSAACMSNSTTTKSPQEWVDEDCLYINVFAPAHCSAEHKCPIITFYHGGGMNYDSAVYYDDKALIETYPANGVILIVPAFRLGFTGQFSLGDNQELVPSNLGVYDALHALKYVKQEAAAFGGDSDAITVMGHSGGGGLSILLAFSPVRKLQVSIDRFVMMSPGLAFDPPGNNEKLSKEMVERAGCSSISKKGTLACMRKKSGPELLAIQRAMEEENAPSRSIFGGIVMCPPLFPFKSIPELLENPPKASILIGTTTKEMDLTPSENAMHGANVGTFIGAKNVKELDEIYDSMTRSDKNNQTHVPESQGLYVGVYITARAMLNKGQRAFVYSYDQPTHNKHTDDLSYLMGIHLFEQDENEKEIAKFYPQLFLNFSKYGEPSPNWKPLNLKDRYYSVEVNLTSGRMPAMRNHYEQETIDFWVRKAPKIDKTITVAKAAGGKMKWDKTTGEFRDLIVEDDSTAATNEAVVPVVVVYASYFHSLLLLCFVFLLGVILSCCFLSDSSSREERVWILGPDGRGMRIDPRKDLMLAKQLF